MLQAAGVGGYLREALAVGRRHVAQVQHVAGADAGDRPERGRIFRLGVNGADGKLMMQTAMARRASAGMANRLLQRMGLRKVPQNVPSMWRAEMRAKTQNL